MSSNTSVEALSNFLSATPEDAASGGELMDRLCQALLPHRDEGLTLADAMTAAKLSRPDFLTTLSRAAGAGLVETFQAADEQRLRLTAAGRSLY
jgi:hypothetical protein